MGNSNTALPDRRRLFSVGIIVHLGYTDSREHGWFAELRWIDGSHGGAGAVEGAIRTTYAVPTLSEAVDLVLGIADRLGVLLLPGESGHRLFYRGDGEDPHYPPPPMWREILAREARRRGWLT